jgi:hypothetical protein
MTLKRIIPVKMTLMRMAHDNQQNSTHSRVKLSIITLNIGRMSLNIVSFTRITFN